MAAKRRQQQAPQRARLLVLAATAGPERVMAEDQLPPCGRPSERPSEPFRHCAFLVGLRADVRVPGFQSTGLQFVAVLIEFVLLHVGRREQHLGVDDEHLDFALEAGRHGAVEQAGHAEIRVPLQVLHLRQGPLPRVAPVVVAEQRVDGEARRAGAQPAKRLVEHVAEPALVVDAVGAQCRAVGIDVVAQHDAEVAPSPAALLIHRPCDRIQAAGRHVAAEGGLEGPRGRRESVQRRIALEPVPGFSGEVIAEAP